MPSLDVLLHLGAVVRVLEACEHLAGAALMRPRRDDASRGCCCRACRDKRCAWTLTPFLRASSISLTTSLIRPQFAWSAILMCRISTAMPARRPISMASRIAAKTLRPLVADVRDEDAAVARDHLAQLDHFVGGRQSIGRHGEHARQALRSLLHRLLDERLHLLELGSASAVGRNRPSRCARYSPGRRRRRRWSRCAVFPPASK